MIVFLNGRFVPEEHAVVSIFDRGFLYGDGLFETIRIFNGTPFRWQQHVERLQRGAALLQISVPYGPEPLRGFVEKLIVENRAPDALLRLTLSRGIGPRGYSPKGADSPFLAMSVHPMTVVDPCKPPRWRLITSSIRLPANQSLAQFKTCNKLPQIFARTEAEARHADEALLLNTDEHVVEAASSNLFWIDQGVVCTSPLNSGILAGVTRSVMVELCQRLHLGIREDCVTLEQLYLTEGVFLSLSSWGVVEAASLDGQTLPLSPISEQIRTAYLKLLYSETRHAR
jgi:aminodeoxychorismate lyase